MKVRILTAIGMAVVGIPILIFSDTIAFPIALAILSLFAVYEMLRVIGFDKKYFVEWAFGHPTACNGHLLNR